MAVLTGMCISVLGLFALLAAAYKNPQNEAEKKLQSAFAGAAAASLLLMIVLVGFWVAVLLSRL